MNFYDTITEMKYVVEKRTPECILIIKKGTECDSLIFFDMKNKEVHGAIKTTNLISTIAQTATWYAMFRSMQADVRKLSEMSGYDII